MKICFVLFIFLIAFCNSHGTLNYPQSRQLYIRSSMPLNRSCEPTGNCLWFSELVEIPKGQNETLPQHARTVNVDITGGPSDFTARNPWRSPGTAQVFGSGCGSAGGGPVAMPDRAGIPPIFAQQGDDGITLAKLPGEPTKWKRGIAVEVAWTIFANHGGGYSYRLCKSDPGTEITEECFQRTPLRFANNTQWIINNNLPNRIKIPLMRVSTGTYPIGSEWVRNPIPGCKPAGSGGNLTRCPFGQREFTEPAPGLSGFYQSDPFNKPPLYTIIDQVIVPTELKPGNYILSWRWDCEQTPQVWQNCADILVE